ncbi:tho complex subunit 1-like protein [Dermatophagoides farinae]|uniref:Tho complex subunit 1-like protein n=1 Tax=Dermatophagoides farinae TaxID=6954 RepID=A0A9D4SLB1_DERFA|nr:THO complex subunit 1-like [Dermatophagoides farinae]KAH7646569.1 tho complex subunit 1-like protein [Dermatophagoides farinae]
MIFEKFKLDLKNCIQSFLTDGDKDLVLSLLNTTERQHYENDFKVIVDTIIREVLLLTLASEKESDYEKLKRLLELSISLAKIEYCSINTPIVLLSELLDCCTLKECELLFSLIDDNIYIWKEDFFFKNVKNQLLRTCNDLLRRLSRNQNTVFCGRILIFLANFFPLFERSGLNLTSEFNQDNSTSYSLQEDEELEENLPDDDDKNVTDEKEVDRIKVDMNFYKKFWQLQEYFRNPTISYQRNNFKNFQNYCNEVLSVFAGYKIDPNSCFYFQALGLDNSNHNNDDKSIFFVKYLTNQKLLELQLSDSNFRRHILIQILIVFQYFTSNVKFRVLENASMNDEQLSWINNIRIKVHQLIEETPPNGKEVRKVIEHLLNREEFWNNWKNEGCCELKQIDEPEDVRKRTADYIASTYVVSQKRARLGEHVRNAINNNKILIGNAELNRLWNFCPDNLDACRSEKRIFTPKLEQFFEPLLKRPSEERQFYCSDPNYCWKSLRLLCQKSNYFFVPSNQVVKPVADYLEGVIEKLAKDYNFSTPKIQNSNNNNNNGNSNNLNNNNNDDNKTETEDISDDELLKNVDSNSVRSNEDDTMDDMDMNVNDSNNNDNNTNNADDVITNNIIDQISIKIQDLWDELSPLFGFTDDELEYIKECYPDRVARIKHLITIWKDEQGPEEGNLKKLQKIINSIKPDMTIINC